MPGFSGGGAYSRANRIFQKMGIAPPVVPSPFKGKQQNILAFFNVIQTKPFWSMLQTIPVYVGMIQMM